MDAIYIHPHWFSMPSLSVLINAEQLENKGWLLVRMENLLYVELQQAWRENNLLSPQMLNRGSDPSTESYKYTTPENIWFSSFPVL